MPANLTPEYMKADKEYKAAVTDEEKLRCLENLLVQRFEKVLRLQEGRNMFHRLVIDEDSAK